MHDPYQHNPERLYAALELVFLDTDDPAQSAYDIVEALGGADQPLLSLSHRAEMVRHELCGRTFNGLDAAKMRDVAHQLRRAVDEYYERRQV